MPDSAEAEAQKFIQEVWGLQGTAYIIVALRYYNKLSTVGWRNLAWDDFLMFLAVLDYTAESVMAYLVVAYWKGFANNAMTDEERAALDPSSAEWTLRRNGSKTHVAGLLLYTTLMWLLKACWLVYYARLTDGVHKMRSRIKWGIAIICSSYVGCLLVAFLKCIPFDHQWQIYPNPGNNCMPAISSLQTIFVMVMNTATDFYLMAIPLPVVWSSKLPLRKKIMLLIMFSGALLETAFGILRCVSILTLGDVDPAQSGYWSVRESFVSITLTNLPLVYPLFKGYIERGRTISRSRATKNSESQSYKLSTVKSGKAHLGSGGGKDQFSIPNETTWGSKEQIVFDGDTAPSSSDGGSLDLPKQQPKIFYSEDRLHAVTASGNLPVRLGRRMTDSDQILVTKEYTVSGDRGRDSGF
ncbi:hypothetical protein F5Y15DRAFT_427541 [Xylariaceae sp. FL0016]|nr:hypothetical protein F5Y15DRAFT_427541 [Xylariaceae sp. FL0016]